MVDPTAVEVGEFVAASADSGIQEGVYRVVGTPEGALVCLRVTDDAGNRASTGDVVRVSADSARTFDRANEPRAGVVDAIVDVVQAPYWLLRSLLSC